MSDTRTPTAALPVRDQLKRKRPGLALGLRAVRTGPLLILILLCVGLFIATPDFLTVNNIANIGIQTSVVAMRQFVLGVLKQTPLPV